MNSEQIELFPLELPLSSQADIIPFPSSARARKVRRVAAVIARKTEKDGKRYWRQISRGIFNQLVRSGVSREQAEAQLIAFRDAVQAEIWGMLDREEQA